MSAEVKERLKTTSEVCQKCYEAWDGNDKDVKAREALQEAIHELRKVASRLEIELAISERDQMTQKPIPIPPHRDSRGGKNRGSGGNKGGGNHDDQNDNDTTVEAKGLKLLVNNEDIEKIKGTEIDYIVTEMGEGFRVNNPNPAPEGKKGECGCGSESSCC